MSWCVAKKVCQFTSIAARLRSKLEAWSSELKPPGLSPSPLSLAGKNYFDHYLDGKKITVAPVEESDEPTVRTRRRELIANSPERPRFGKPPRHTRSRKDLGIWPFAL